MKIAIVGATGLVGQEMARLLDEYTDIPLTLLIPVASANSMGKTVSCRGGEWPICTMIEAQALRPNVAFFSAGSTLSREEAKRFTDMGCLVIDNSSAWREDEEVPLVVPEINADTIKKGDKLIANPNCSTIQLLMALKPIHDKWGLERVVVSTYQSVTGSGMRAMRQFEAETKKQTLKVPAYPHPIFKNCIPHCDDFLENDYTKEEMKLIKESRRILKLPKLRITATAVRVPVYGGHSESVNLTLKKKFEVSEVQELMAESPGLSLLDNPATETYPMPVYAQGRNEVFVGRIRRDESEKNSLNLWIVADNLRKGAATNAVQILQHMIEEDKL